ncbi:unnamed protein product [Linum trigynum]|uniref:Uncharacterized protein n=1 Tax=Linum trigynum TaxID=586398 RepID=A0AAV2ERX2_9ROSI
MINQLEHTQLSRSASDLLHHDCASALQVLHVDHRHGEGTRGFAAGGAVLGSGLRRQPDELGHGGDAGVDEALHAALCLVNNPAASSLSAALSK